VDKNQLKRLNTSILTTGMNHSPARTGNVSETDRGIKKKKKEFNPPPPIYIDGVTDYNAVVGILTNAVDMRASGASYS
jgi:hypothetical protein